MRLGRFIPATLTLAAAAFGSAVDVGAKSAAVFDAATGRMLWGKDPDTPRYPASTTKILTGLLLVERCQPDEVITAPPDTETVTGSSMHLRPGERVTARHLLAAILLRSANDGCHALAVHLAGSDAEFAELMNERARQIGCTNSSFNNPHGLNDKAHTSTARDLGLIACVALRNPWFAETARQRKWLLERSANQEDLWLFNKNKLLGADPTVDGVKTGYTTEAGHCFVGSATRSGVRVVTVVLDSPDWKKDTRNLLEWAFRTHGVRTVVRQGAPGPKVPVRAGSAKAVPTAAAAPLKLLVPLGSSPRLKATLVAPSALQAPVRAGQPVGEVRFEDGRGWSAAVPLSAAADVPRAPRLTQSPLFLAAACGVPLAWAFVRRRAARSRRRRSQRGRRW
ncbi:MAG: D-alanyl-D-alanine carboxypeptidase [Fimbriimonadales bacterium]|nr:D-alanyl-D-alanine carboxypeptidase [Fimbriimonadales bacterium]